MSLKEVLENIGEQTGQGLASKMYRRHLPTTTNHLETNPNKSAQGCLSIF
jgi:hypothetical protein